MSANARMGFTLAAIVVVVCFVGFLIIGMRPPTGAGSSHSPTMPQKMTSEEWAANDLLARLNSKDAYARLHALDPTRFANWRAEMKYSPQSVQAVAARVRQMLADETPSVRLAAAQLVESNGLHPHVKRDEAVPACETLLADADEETRTRAAVIVWRYNGTPEAGKVLVSAVSGQPLAGSFRLFAVVPTDAPPHTYPDGMIPAVERVIAHRREEAAVRLNFLNELASAFDKGTKPTADFEQLVSGLMDDTSASTDVRGGALALLVRVNGGKLPDGLRKTANDLAATSRTPVPVRVRLIAALGPRAESFAKEYPVLASQLVSAVTDPIQAPAYRAFAAHFFTPDTDERFDDALRLMAETDATTATLRRVLAERMMAEHARKPWATDTPFPNSRLRLMALCPSRHLSPRVAFGYADSGEPWQQVPANTPGADFDAAFVSVLVKAAPQVLPAVVNGLGNNLTRRRNLEVLLKRGDAAIEADRIALLLAVTDLTEDERPLAAELAGKLKTWDTLAAWLRAGKPARERLPELVKEWKAARKDPVPLLVGLLTHERFEVRERAAAEIGKIGPDAKAAISKLAEQLVADTHSAEPYVSALAAVGPDSLPPLAELTRHKDQRIRTAAVDALGRLGPEVRSKATPVLRLMIEQEKDVSVKAAALNALGKVNPDAAKQLGWYER